MPPRPASDWSRAERIVGIRKLGGGQQYEIQWHGEEETTWEAASRVRREAPALVRAYEERQQQPQAQQLSGEGDSQQGEDADMADEEGERAADDSDMRQQMEVLQNLVREQSQQIQQLRSSPVQSQPSPVLIPASQSRFARKEPRAQDLREYEGASGAKLDEWLDELGAAVELYELNDGEAVRFAASRLREAARQW
jgi:hypothetical protein